MRKNAVPDEEPAKPKKDFDGVGIGLIDRPRICDGTTNKGDLVKVTFNVSLGDGTLLDDRYLHKPLEFIIGDGSMIGGFNAGLEGMCVNERRRLTVPTQYGYGTNSMGNMPSRVTLYFDVKLLSFATPDPSKMKNLNQFKQIDSNKDNLLSPDEVKEYLQDSGFFDQPGDNGIKQMMRDIFKEEDRNYNGYIEHEEFSGPKRDEL